VLNHPSRVPRRPRVMRPVRRANDMGHDNATWLFKTPTDTYHSSESFWASLVGLYVLSVSSAGRPCRIPTYRYCEDTAGWWFEPDAPLVLSANLQFPDVVVGGRLTHETFPRLGALPHDLANLKPDIIIQSPHRTRNEGFRSAIIAVGG